eukprot:TRINITY_DN978_c0_g2_i1.p1 TRINITY_DN978_c0_g2~~TRINITY_DN978_c0_g2_i1.p1  ORF type:complete len:649 (-),score=57.62 TRINITY_DN978_c0_g2_i1:58-2004(-)
MAILFMFRIVLFYLCLTTVLARPQFRDAIPNGYNVPSWAGVGHLMPEGGGPRNQFGLDFAAAGYNWTMELCQLDSDGDGIPNGVELGDPSCVWTPGQTPERTTAITHPGLPDNPNNPGFCTPTNSYADSFTVDLKVTNLVIPNNTGDYVCQGVPLDTSDWPLGVNESNTYIVKFEPLVDLTNIALVQHIILLECTVPYNHSGVCPLPNYSKCDRVAYAWGPTDTQFCLPHFVGMPVNPIKFYLLKVYYNNPSQLNDRVDNSGLRLTITANETIQVPAGVLMTGRIESRRLVLPSGQVNTTISGVCPAICTNQILTETSDGINVFSSFLFMHSLGRRIWTELSNNATSQILGEDLDFTTTNYTFSPNTPFDKVQRNDKIFTSCEYDTSSTTGDVVEGEVCFSFLMHYPRLELSAACGSFIVDRYRDNRETAFCGSAGLWDVANDTPVPYASCPTPANVDTHLNYALDTILPQCKVDGVDQCNDTCKVLVRTWLEHPCVEVYGIRYMFDFVCANQTCDEFQALLRHNCYGLCAYNLQSEQCLVPAGNISSYNCINHECVPVYMAVAPPTDPTPITTPVDPTPTTTPTTAPADLTPSNSVRFNQRYGPAYYAMMSVVVAIGVAVAGFAVGFFVWKTVQNRELNYNANIHPN